MRLPTRRDCVPVAPLREAFERANVPPIQVALALDWYDRGRPDGARVRRVLGLKPYEVGGTASDPRRKVRRERITPALAVRVAAAMGLDPVDIGL